MDLTELVVVHMVNLEKEVLYKNNNLKVLLIAFQ